jgi:hypothetical protein
MPRLILDNWQNEVIEAEGDILLATGRQVGKTTVLAIKAAKRMIEKPTKILVASLTEDQAELIIQKTLDFLEENYKSSIMTKRDKPTKKIIKLKNGSIMQARAVGNTGNSLRGFTADVFIPDEASRLPSDLWAAAFPTILMTGGEVWMASTPFGRSGFFWDSFRNEDGRWKIFRISSEDAIKERKICVSWSEKQRNSAIRNLDKAKKDMPKILYQQEYGGEFVEDLMQWFPDELIQKSQKLQRQPASSKGVYFLGVDIGGRGGAESTFEILDRRNRLKLIHVESIVEPYDMTTMSERQIIHLDNIWHFRKIYIDSGGIGTGVFDHLLETPQIKRKIIAIENASRALTPDVEEHQKLKRLLKEDLYKNLRGMMERGEIEILDDPEIFQSLKSVQFEIDTETKTLKIFGNYTHIAEGLIRAAWSQKDKSLNLYVY